jgi:hypothetical protein
MSVQLIRFIERSGRSKLKFASLNSILNSVFVRLKTKFRSGTKWNLSSELFGLKFQVGKFSITDTFCRVAITANGLGIAEGGDF